MSEWDYLPTPYEKLVEDQKLNSLLVVMSLGCLLVGKVIHPIEMIQLCNDNHEYGEILNRELNKISLIDGLRTMLQYEDLRSFRKRERVLEILRRHVGRSRTEDI